MAWITTNITTNIRTNIETQGRRKIVAITPETFSYANISRSRNGIRGASCSDVGIFDWYVL